MLLIAGNGRNVGKTTLACKIISHLSKSAEVTGIKISSHFHDYLEEDIILKNDNFIILEERRNTLKDSSLMWQSGARKVFFVMAKQEHLKEAAEQLYKLLLSHAIICESGGLHEFVQPGLFLFVNLNGREVVKKHHLRHHPVTVKNDGKNFDLNIESIRFLNQQITISNE